MAEADHDPADLRIETNEITPVIHELSVEVDAGDVNAAFAEVVKQLRKGARVKGFRPGKVPTHVIKQMYGASLGEE
ncbi:MAG TPA: trigger factor family protein, partial [Deltaproteobacteria bacterium]|nr:trigger factor family protein [Deltaproteobacteria bacterium]